MTWTPRLIAPGELDATIDLTAVAFGVGPKAPPDYLAQARALTEPGRTFAVTDGGRVVGTAALFTFDVAVPGGGRVALAAVTEAGVLPTHRRRGVLSALIEALHDQAIERGEPLAGLTASEGGIYRRFGYGVATRFHRLVIDATRATEVDGVAVSDAEKGTIRLIDEAEAATVLPAIWDRHWRRVPGEVSRTPGWWACEALDIEHERDGASARYIAVHDGADGTPDGFVVYRIAQNFGAGGADHHLRIVDLGAASDAVAAELVRFACRVDLVTSVVWRMAPTDGPLRWRLADPRALQVTAERDVMWLRPLDVAACLAARRYAADGGVVVEVVDARRPGLGGRFRLEGGPDGADCARTDREPEVVVRTAELGSLLLGGVSWTTLHRAGLVEERAAGALDRADALFRTDRAPFCGTEF
ncbi:MAG TPA: GNAT family N-acetyltransferase [Acidimicrobiales bacterium]|nr:GNAT family N-acetyltransferase [Acidimicrobiales bacterium]